MRSLSLFGAVVALVAAQTANAAPLKVPATHIDPLLSLSLLASEHSRTIACAHGDINVGADTANGNCAAANEDGYAQAGFSSYGAAGAAHSAFLSALGPAIFGFATYLGVMFALTNDIHVRGPVSPA